MHLHRNRADASPRAKPWMEHMSDEDDAPTVTYNRIDKKAFFIFRRRRYELLGEYKNLAEAQHVAEKECRSMRWISDKR